VSYAGSSRVTQKSAQETLSEHRYRTQILVIAVEDPAEVPSGQARPLRLVVTRSLSPASGDAEGSGDADEEGPQALTGVFEVRGAGGELVTGEPPLELDALASRFAMLLPWNLTPPMWAASSAAATAEVEVEVLGLAHAKGRFRRDARREGSSHRFVRELEAGAQPTFQLEERPAVLAAWKEDLSFDAARGLLNKASFACKVVVDADGTSVEVESLCEYALQSARKAEGAETAKLAETMEKLQKLDAGFRALDPGAKLAPEVEALDAASRSGDLAPLGLAARTRLEKYRETFEKDDSGKVLRSLLGKTAPDFTLEDLKGNRVRFHEARKDKVTLLSFWGVG
jgi:hypothetical protein